MKIRPALFPVFLALLLPWAASAQSSRSGMGAIPYADAGGTGVTFRTWAPNASTVVVKGAFNGWGSTALIKESSILACSALTELTKAGDYIRSKTYSAFTPYIVSGILYLIVTGVLTKLLGKLERRLRQGDNR